jgi:hypothetical protein
MLPDRTYFSISRPQQLTITQSKLTDEAFLAYRKTLLAGYLADFKTWMEKKL